MAKKFDKEFYTRIGIALTVIIVATAVILGAWRTKNETPESMKDAAEVYNQAVARLTSAENIYYKVTGSKTITENQNSISEAYTQLITYEAQNSTTFRGCVEEELEIGTQNIRSFEFYSDGVAYFTTQGASFQAQMTQNDYLNRYTPAVTITPALYAEISGIKTPTKSTISFKKPGAVEIWVAEDGCSILDATASAVLNKNGDLTESNYSVNYTADHATVNLQVKVEIFYNEIPPIQLPDGKAYTPVSDISVPKLLERSCGYLTAMQSIYAEYADSIFCEAFGDQRTQTSTLSASTIGDFVAEVDTTVSVSNSSKAGSVSTANKCERFENGIYSYATDGATYQQENSVDQTTMQDYIESLLIGTILLPEHIASVEVTETDNEIQLKFQPKADFADILAQDACIMVYQNATILIEQASSYTTDSVSSYLNIAKGTGMPTSSGFYYSGTYTIGGIPYKLSFKADQTYSAEEVLEEDKTVEEIPTEDTQAAITQ